PRLQRRVRSTPGRPRIGLRPARPRGPRPDPLRGGRTGRGPRQRRRPRRRGPASRQAARPPQLRGPAGARPSPPRWPVFDLVRRSLSGALRPPGSGPAGRLTYSCCAPERPCHGVKQLRPHHVSTTGVSRIATVTGREPFLVPSQPGIAIEKRPAVPPATTTCSSSGEGNLGIG